MSRAFVKEADGEQAEEELPDRPVSPHPNYVTDEGLVQLRRQVALLREELATLGNDEDLATRNTRKQVERDLRYYQARLRQAIPVAAVAAGDTARFGTTVTLCDEQGQQFQVTIVGEDQADPAAGLISWVSPLARELIGRQVGDEVTWRRPAGEQTLEIDAVESPAHDEE